PRCCMVVVSLHVFVIFRNVFFFQAEDGIRDATVTGVQTCALPISKMPGLALLAGVQMGEPRHLRAPVQVVHLLLEQADLRHLPRSEERRVGKECRSARWLYL